MPIGRQSRARPEAACEPVVDRVKWLFDEAILQHGAVEQLIAEAKTLIAKSREIVEVSDPRIAEREKLVSKTEQLVTEAEQKVHRIWSLVEAANKLTELGQSNEQ